MKILCALILLFSVLPSHGASRVKKVAADVPPPQAPWIAPIPERGRWLVKINDPRAEPRADENGNPVVPTGVNRLPVQIENMTWNAVKRDIIAFTDGTKETIFYFAGFVLVEGRATDGKPAPVLVQQLPGTDFTSLRSGGWLGLEWVGEGYFQGVEEFSSSLRSPDAEPEICYVYRKPEGRIPGSEEWLPEMKAWIRVTDLQPVALSIRQRTFEFQRLDPPTEPPKMSQEQAAKLLDLKDQHDRMNRIRERTRRLRGN